MPVLDPQMIPHRWLLLRVHDQGGVLVTTAARHDYAACAELRSAELVVVELPAGVEGGREPEPDEKITTRLTPRGFKAVRDMVGNGVPRYSSSSTPSSCLHDLTARVFALEQMLAGVESGGAAR